MLLIIYTESFDPTIGKTCVRIEREEKGGDEMGGGDDLQVGKKMGCSAMGVNTRGSDR